MEVTPEIFDHVAKLAKLRFEDNEKEALRAEMQKMVSFVEKLNEVDTTGVAPLMHMSMVQQIPRNDDANTPLTKEAGLRNAPKHDGQHFLVPKVIDSTTN